MKGIKGLISLGILMILLLGLSVSAQATLVDMHDGTIYDTATQLSWLKNTDTAGLMTWDQAVAWAASLNNNGGFAGLTGWRLPNADPTCNGGGAGYNCTGSEMGYLYYVSLGNVAGGPLIQTGPFQAMPVLGAAYYWSGTELNTLNAWYFNFSLGTESYADKGITFYAWAVRPGARSVSSATPVGYSPQWLLITLVSLLIAGGLLLRKRIARQ